MKNNIHLIIILFLVILLNGCRGDQRTKLIGNWEQIPFTDPETNTSKTYWQFYAGDAVIIKSYVDGIATKDSLQYTYSIEGSVFDVYSGVDDPTYLPANRDPRGQYWIDQLTDDQFKITKRKHPDGSTSAVYVRVELVKR